MQSQIHMPFSLKQSKKPTIFRQVSEAHHHQRSLSSSSTSSETCSGSFIFSTFVFEGLRVNEARKQEVKPLFFSLQEASCIRKHVKNYMEAQMLFLSVIDDPCIRKHVKATMKAVYQGPAISWKYALGGEDFG